LQLDRFELDQILEYRIQQAEAEVSGLAADEPPVPEDATQSVQAIESPPRTPAPFVNAVADGTPTPGGGAVAALAGALCAALSEMVAGVTVGKKRYADVEETMQAIIQAAGDLRGRLVAAIDEDVTAFNALMDAYRMSKDDDGRAAAIQAATTRAADVPLNVARLAVEAMQLAEQVARQGNQNAATDAGVAVLSGLSAVEGASLNVRVNVTGLDDDELAARYRHDVTALVERARELRDSVITVVEERAEIS
jgi:formiminotetrahydrofolate cyclodeaminase